MLGYTIDFMRLAIDGAQAGNKDIIYRAIYRVMDAAEERDKIIRLFKKENLEFAYELEEIVKRYE